ncbi:hypothetical protein [Rhizobium ruizarguesonis]|uniref:hypothetical protein n=1 Tax=Rhizobium ruizarguesonis TaxID=2081791 RepID=UPI00102FBF2D|nr:hypothetical protein [Rhizobium ruizarguesonis]TAV14734.1 hypothetical protein ELI34_04300 [Rhizobium ruizarguesonis]
MTFDEAMAVVAHKADEVAWDVMQQLDKGRTKHEDDLSGELVGALRERLKDFRVGGLTFDTSILTHRKSGEEGKYGADIMFHVELKTPEQDYSKGVLIQSKRIGPDQNMPKAGHDELRSQCNKMLKFTGDAYVFCYDKAGLRTSSATKVVGGKRLNVYDRTEWTAYRFFLELFRCPVGDPRITSADVSKLRPRHGLHIIGTGDLG